jgi:hypothetical protein
MDMMNKKGQAVMVGIMIAIMVFIIAVNFITPIKDVVTQARSSSNLDCDNTSITTGNRMTCIAVDLYLFNFIGIAIFGGLAYIIGKKFVRPTQ